MTTNKPNVHLTAEQIRASKEYHITHPLNPAADVYMRPLSFVAGLERCGLSLARIPPGKESFIYHRHELEEEFLYVLSGRGRAEVEGEWIELGAGDFLAFPAPSVSHQLTNPYQEDLVYLMGGERRAVEIAEFPRLRKRMVRHGESIWITDTDTTQILTQDDYLVKEQAS